MTSAEPHWQPSAGSSEAHAFWVTGAGSGAIRSVRLDAPTADDVGVRTLFSGISRGTESLVFRQAVPPSEYQRMRAPFQDGAFPAPVKYGYANVGLVEVGPASLVGRTVFCLFPHQNRYVVPADAVLPLPEAVPAGRAVLAANMETAINGLWDGAPQVGARLAVVGGGVVGCMIATLAAHIPGARVTLVDINPARAALADALGLGFSLPSAELASDADLVVHASGSPEGLNTALRLAGFEATVLEMSWYGATRVPAPLGEAFHSKRLTLRSSQVGAVAPTARPRWSRRQRLALALDLLADPVFDHLISGESEFADLPTTMARLADQPGDALCHRIRYDGGAAP